MSPLISSSRLRPLAGAVLLALLGVNASAQGMPQGGPVHGAMNGAMGHGMAGHGMHAHAGDHAERMGAAHTRRLDALKAKLQLSSAQESAWNTFASAMQARPAMGSHAQQREEMMRLSTPERLERMKALRAQHQGEMNAFMDRRAQATQSFYTTLTPEQKKVFDAETARMMDGHRHGEGHPHHGPQGRG